jgi:hypothetical protein
VYDENNPNSAHYPVRHRLDLRYSYTGRYSLGNVTWYIELMNVYMNKVHEEKWKFNKPYLGKGKNPPDTKAADDEGSWIIPNFGVEIKF